jgi:hypothetical protein
MRLAHGRTQWRAFLRGRAKADAGARLLFRIGGKCPSETHRLIDVAAKSHKIDGQSYRARRDILERVRSEYESPTPRAMPTPANDWRSLGDGAHMRVDHFKSVW